MVPLNLSTVERLVGERPDARRVFILSEGTNTEPEFLEKVLTNASYITNKSVRFVKVNKIGNDVGVTDFDGLLSLAYSIIDNKENHFNKRYDKVMLIFDLDVYYARNKIDYIKEQIKKHSKYIMFVFANPAIELFLLLCCRENAYETIIQPNLDDIIKNDWVTSKDGKKRRFVANLFFETTGIDPKVKTADFTELANNIQFGVNQEKIYLSQKIGAGSNKVISNFGKIIDNIKNDAFTKIEYLL